VGYDNQEVINSIVSSVDTEEIEQQRKMNASYKKFILEPQPLKDSAHLLRDGIAYVICSATAT